MTASGSVGLEARAVVRLGAERRAEPFRLEAHLRVAEGETLAVMGPSGAGKSTLLAALAGAAPLAEGTVTLDGRELSRPGRQVEAASRQTVLLSQDPRLFPHLTARENVAFGLRARRVARPEAHARADELLVRVGLGGAADRRPSQLSGGQQQRVALARALAAAPRLVLLDEPLTSLDLETAAEIRMLLTELLADITCVVVTHDAVDALAWGDRLCVLEAGRVTQSGAVREVLAAPATAFVAAQAGLNRIAGEVRGGVWHAGPAAARIPDVPDGPAVAVFPPAAVSVRPPARADGVEPEPAWRATVRHVAQTVAGVRLAVDDPALAADVSLEDWAQAPVRAGDEVVLAIDPRRIRALDAGQEDHDDRHPALPAR